MNPLVSVIICTCDRADDLRRTLASLANVCVPDGLAAELVVVDNASADDTAEVVHSCRLPDVPVRYVREPRRGKGHAYNAGMAEARGQVFLFTDDDVRPPPDWIAGMCRPILGGGADAVAGGVRLAPHLRRDWMRPKHRSLLASTERLDPLCPEDMVGANMAFSRRVTEKVPRFDTDLGPGALGFADDSLFSYQLKKAGYRMAAALGTEVEHHFQASRLSRMSFLQTAKKMGRSSGYLTHHWHHGGPGHLSLRLLKMRMELVCWRASHRRKRLTEEGITLRELSLVTNVHFYAYLCHQRGGATHYTRHGLIRSVGPAQ